MPYLSEMVGRPVTDTNGERIGRLEDLIAARRDVAPPQIVALAIKRGSDLLLIPYEEAAALLAPAIPLLRPLQDIRLYEPSENDLYLARDILDKQIIDTDGVRVVRVNDLELARVNGHFFVVNVDIGGLGLMRRLGLARPTEKVAGRLGRKLASNSIPWDAVELLPGNQPMRLKVPSDKISELHPADLAALLSDLSRADSSRLLDSLDMETLADTLEEVEPDFQASLVEDMSDERVADLLEEMAPDEAADLLAELGEDRSEDLLNLMEKDEAADVRRLLTYPENSVGGIMTTEYVAVRPDLTALQAMAFLRKVGAEAETINYVYVTDRRR